MKILIFLLYIGILHASSYPHFTQNEFIHIEKKAGKIAKNRARDYSKNVAKFQTFKKTKQLTAVNHYLNQLLSGYDDVIQKKENHWATPKEFIMTGYGDCEDYVIIKYFTLLKLGFDKKKLFLTTVFEKHYGGYHMVLSYFKDKGKSPLILDNLSFKILDLKTRVDIKADIFINSTGVYKMGKNNELYKIAHSAKEYDELMQRVKKNR